jgi:hypothetical protein
MQRSVIRGCTAMIGAITISCTASPGVFPGLLAALALRAALRAFNALRAFVRYASSGLRLLIEAGADMLAVIHGVFGQRMLKRPRGDLRRCLSNSL